MTSSGGGVQQFQPHGEFVPVCWAAVSRSSVYSWHSTFYAPILCEPWPSSIPLRPPSISGPNSPPRPHSHPHFTLHGPRGRFVNRGPKSLASPVYDYLPLSLAIPLLMVHTAVVESRPPGQSPIPDISTLRSNLRDPIA